MQFLDCRKLAVVGLFLLRCLTGTAAAQDAPPLSSDQMERALKNKSLQQLGDQPPLHNYEPSIISPAPGPIRPSNRPSRLEQNMSARAEATLQQFGYDQVGVGSSVRVPQTGAIQDDYVLGAGDELDIVLRGQENSDFSISVDRNGQVIVPRLEPLAAAGLPLKEFREVLAAAVHRAYIATSVSVSVSTLRQVTVMVTGAVENPGLRILTGLSGPLDAILLSGGVKKDGSLRNIKLIHDGKSIPIDLYDLLTGSGLARFPKLKDGDRIFVPPIGTTVGVTGYVRRPAIYELNDGRKDITASDLLALANGPSLRGAHTISIEHVMPDGRMRFIDVTDEPGTILKDGEVMIARSAINVSLDRVQLVGAVQAPGAFALGKYPTLHDLLPSSDALVPGAYMLLGIIDRIDPSTLQRTAVPFSPLQVVQGKENYKLISRDTVHVLTKEEMRTLIDIVQGRPQRQPPRPKPESETVGTDHDLRTPPAQAGSAQARFVSAHADDSESTTALAPSVDLDYRTASRGRAVPIDAADQPMTQISEVGQPTGDGGALLNPADLSPDQITFFGNMLSDYRVDITGAVHDPGAYLVAPNTTLEEAVIAAGGLSGDVDLKSFEFTSTRIDNVDGTSVTARYNYPADQAMLSHIILRPFDRVDFHHVFSDKTTGTVSIEGEVRYPGTYNILREEHLSSILKRAGGFTNVAFANGAVFLRQSVARMEEAERVRNAADLRSQLLTAMVRSTDAGTPPVSADAVMAAQGLLQQIQNTPVLGRISIHIDPIALAMNPSLDPLLQPGDRIVIPKRPTSILVVGEVLRPGATRFNSSLSVGDYIEEAGGFTQYADTSRVIVVLPNGDAHLVKHSWLSGWEKKVPLGSTIFIPRDLTGLSLSKLIVDTTQIFSQLATSAAALAFLSR